MTANTPDSIQHHGESLEPMSRPANVSLSKAGIKKLSNGDSVIPSSTRADGSVRKEIRVKPGYKPPEDVEVYKNRTAEAWKNRGKAGVPGAEPSSDEVSLPLSAAALKNAKRKEARKKAAAVTASEEVVDGDVPAPNETTVAVDQELDKAKEARKLAKKLRQARELQDKKDHGDSLLPEQLSKVIKINELVRQLDALGFDPEGEEKVDATTVKPG